MVAAKKEKLVLMDSYVETSKLRNMIAKQVARLRNVFSMQNLQMQMVFHTVERLRNGVGCAQKMN